ncbi:hypothetical protein GEMRC1_014149 [Eukaryota sp. GEM-RC1]
MFSIEDQSYRAAFDYDADVVYNVDEHNTEVIFKLNDGKVFEKAEDQEDCTSRDTTNFANTWIKAPFSFMLPPKVFDKEGSKTVGVQNVIFLQRT